MNLQPTIDAALFEIAEESDHHELRSEIWEDYLLPVFLKKDPAEGARTFAKVKAAPNEHLRLIKNTLREHLEDKPEALHKLQHLLGIEGE